MDDDEPPGATPILADVGEVHKVLAQIAQRHFHEHQVKEVDTLASFMYAVKAKGTSSFKCLRLGHFLFSVDCYDTTTDAGVVQ